MYWIRLVWFDCVGYVVLRMMFIEGILICLDCYCWFGRWEFGWELWELVVGGFLLERRKGRRCDLLLCFVV